MITMASMSAVDLGRHIGAPSTKAGRIVGNETTLRESGWARRYKADSPGGSRSGHSQDILVTTRRLVTETQVFPLGSKASVNRIIVYSGPIAAGT
jgi:hypothetical protein